MVKSLKHEKIKIEGCDCNEKIKKRLDVFCIVRISGVYRFLESFLMYLYEKRKIKIKKEKAAEENSDNIIILK